MTAASAAPASAPAPWWPGSTAAVPTYAVGGTDVLTNDRVDRADNAAVALRLLGQRDRLVWYVPDPRDVAAGDAGPSAAQLPRWAGARPCGCGAAAVLAMMLWRGRRLGPLVVEPLPVVVKAVESTQGRGRLYRRVRDRAHAAEILRAATRRRLAARLRLPAPRRPRGARRAPVARHTGRDPATCTTCSSRRPVPDDAALTRLADDLAALEREVHHAMTQTRPDATVDRPTAAREALTAVRAEVAKAVVGQDAAVSGLLVALLTGGHVLMEGVPGVAKTLLVRSLAAALAVETKRVQFTPDLMPGDITGSMVYRQPRRAS